MSPAGARRRKFRNLTKLNDAPTVGRLAVVNHFNRTVSDLAPKTNYPRLQAFLPQNLWPWVAGYLKFAFTPRYAFPDYESAGVTGIYPISPAGGSSEIRLAIAGDWATGTQEAETIAGLMSAAESDFTIHLGDIYYVGGAAEIDETCLGKPRGDYQGVTWPHGKQGSFSLNGNHEMYANGKPYFTQFLPTLGMQGSPRGQIASFFCLEAERWRVIGLDTGYNSVGIPILSQIPWINTIGFIGGDCHLEKKLISWLRDAVKPKENRKATLLLSHHQYFTAFDDHFYTRPAKQLLEFFPDQEVVWMWGHEHRLALYNPHKLSGGISAHGRCLGHSGMPVDLGTPDANKAPLLLYDPRTHPLEDGTLVGENGFVTATIAGEVLSLDYRDIRNTRLLLEEFRAGGDGSLEHRIVEQPGILKPAPK